MPGVKGFILALMLSGIWFSAFSQVVSTDKRYVRIGELQNHYTAYGSDRAWNNTYYEGLQWPAGYFYQDNSVIRRQWIGCADFTSAKNEHYDHFAITFSEGNVNTALFPVELKQTGRFALPTVYVDGTDVNAPYASDVDVIDETIIPDRIVVNKVNSLMGLTITRTIYAFSQQYHNNYFIQIWKLENTGNTDYDDEIELTNTLKGVRFSFGVRYSVSRDGSSAIGGSQTWGKWSWVTKRGETYAQHYGEKITEADPIVDWIRCGFEFAGQNPTNAFDNIGGPYLTKNGRLAAPQHAGIAVLHVDKSASDHSDDPAQPNTLGWHAGDTVPSVSSYTPDGSASMDLLYSMISGNPYMGLGGTNRFDETYMATKPDPSSVHNDGGGTNLWVCYGPWDLAHGESVTIIEAEGISGLNRLQCETIGSRWKQAYLNPADKGPFTLPNGTTTTEKDVYKNQWVFTGKDSILMTFGRAKRALDANFLIPQPPLPPPVVDVKSGGDRITISWTASPSEIESDFAGYKVFRAVGRTDTVFQEIYSGGKDVHSFADVTAIRGISYYYYVSAFNDGSKNATGECNPTGPLMSGRYYTQTSEPAYLRRQAGDRLEDEVDSDGNVIKAGIRIVPNPYDIKSRVLQYTGENDKIMFLNIPGHCTIRIYTERGDLVNQIEHEDGSGDESWNSITSSRQVVVSGIYIVHFEVTQDQYDSATNTLLYKKGDTAIRKLVIIR
jgi:hypothetical protein